MKDEQQFWAAELGEVDPEFGPAAKVVLGGDCSSERSRNPMKSTRTRHSAAFKAKVALAAIREQETVPELARHHGVHANQIYRCKRQFLEQAAVVFERDSETSSGGTEREEELLKKMGELTVEPILSRGLQRRH
jgi:transposase